MNGFLHHLLTSLRLNFRNKQAIVFGYLVPVFFLIAFGTIFSGKYTMPMRLGQVMTISVLGGACFGLPITFVNERERGIWRRYRLTPMPTFMFMLSTLLSRYLIVASSGLLQIALAHWFFNVPWPVNPVRLLLAFTLVSFAFLGIGLVIAMLASSTGAVQAIGQSLFLPMIIIGGVGVERKELPKSMQHVAAFLPGRYSVDALRLGITELTPLPKNPGFSLLALAVTGAAACLAAAKLFRWENQQRPPSTAWLWVLLAVGVWAAVGLGAEYLRIV